MKEMDKNYDHKAVEDGKFEMWNKSGYFKASGDLKDKRKTFSMIIPPPNVTGVLHVGHALDATLHDIIARYKRLNGYDVSFVPGTDHAGIATQAKVEGMLKKKGVTRYDLGRDKFIEETYKWKDESAKVIHDQWKAIGVGMDYDREFFTMDEKTSYAVKVAFKKLYDEGLIYQGERIINWDAQLQTALSDIEVVYKDIPGVFYYFTYHLVEDKSVSFTVATTRPETMFGDVCLVFNPKDTRYKKYEGMHVINPANGEIIPIISDYYVDKEFGTGLMKCTPAHDPHDFEIAKRHDLPIRLCMNKDGTMNDLAGEFESLDRYDCREKLVSKIQKEGNLVKKEDIVHSVGHSERSDTVVEPILSKQWFIAMEKLSKDVLEKMHSSEKIKFFPSRFEKIFINWLKSTKDWCISRQLWWGHRIPIYTNKKTKEVVCSVEKMNPAIWEQDEDVLDTWFSSGLSPFVLCNWPDLDNPYFKKYYPLDLMVTGYDIIFFWVARMAFDGVHFTGKLPFKNVFLHGLVRDEKGRKMSKSLGNGVDPIKVCDEYGADSLRYSLATSATPGLDISFGYERIKASHVFLNKVWNASRFVLLNFPENFKVADVSKLKLNFIDECLYKHFDTALKHISKNIDKYELGQAGNYLYSFIYDSFCSSYIEEAKIDLFSDDEERKNVVLNVLYDVLKKVLIILFPYAPFISEEIYSYLPSHKQSIYEESWPTPLTKTLRKASLGEELEEIITFTRQYRADNKLVQGTKIDIKIKADEKTGLSLKPYLERLGMANSYSLVTESDSHYRFFGNIGVYLSTPEVKQSEADIEKRVAQLKAELDRSHKMLSNPNFLNKAPADKIKLEQEKLAKYQAEYDKYTSK